MYSAPLSGLSFNRISSQPLSHNLVDRVCRQESGVCNAVSRLVCLSQGGFRNTTETELDNTYLGT